MSRFLHLLAYSKDGQTHDQSVGTIGEAVTLLTDHWKNQGKVPTIQVEQTTGATKTEKAKRGFFVLDGKEVLGYGHIIYEIEQKTRPQIAKEIEPKEEDPVVPVVSREIPKMATRTTDAMEAALRKVDALKSKRKLK